MSTQEEEWLELIIFMSISQPMAVDRSSTAVFFAFDEPCSFIETIIYTLRAYQSIDALDVVSGSSTVCQHVFQSATSILCDTDLPITLLAFRYWSRNTTIFVFFARHLEVHAVLDICYHTCGPLSGLILGSSYAILNSVPAPKISCFTKGVASHSQEQETLGWKAAARLCDMGVVDSVCLSDHWRTRSIDGWKSCWTCARSCLQCRLFPNVNMDAIHLGDCQYAGPHSWKLQNTRRHVNFCFIQVRNLSSLISTSELPITDHAFHRSTHHSTNVDGKMYSAFRRREQYQAINDPVEHELLWYKVLKFDSLSLIPCLKLVRPCFGRPQIHFTGTTVKCRLWKTGIQSLAFAENVKL